MITYETLKEYRDKCQETDAVLRKRLSEAKHEISEIAKHLIAINAQIETLTDLMENPRTQTIEVPMIEDEEELQKLHDKRLDFFEGQNLEEFQKERQEKVYKKEAMDIAEAINAENEN